MWLSRPIPTFVVTALFAGLVAAALKWARNPGVEQHIQYVPIGAVFAVFFWDRLLPHGLLSMVAGMIAALLVARWRNVGACGPQARSVRL